MSQRICSVDDCDRPATARGWCGMHYNRWRRHGDPGRKPMEPPSLYERWAAKVSGRNDPESCWVWTAHRSVGGYGRIDLPGYRVGSIPAHRFAYEHFIGPVPHGKELDHICRNRGCVNPRHLRPVSRKQNAENRGPSSSSTSGYRGVAFNRREGKFKVQVTHNRVRHHGGTYATAEEANEAAVALRNRLYTHNDQDRTLTDGH